MKQIYQKFLKHFKKGNKLDDYFSTSESVSPGHPDKICDQVSDAILDEYLKNDPHSKVAAEVMAAPKNIIIAGEIKSKFTLKPEKLELLIRNLLKKIGYYREPFSYKTVKITNLLHRQSPEISIGVEETKNHEEGAGDQGIMFGFACDETDVLMPAPIVFSHRIMENIVENKHKNLGPDAKCQVTLEYDKNQKPYRAESIIVSIQHDKKLSQDDVKDIIKPIVIDSLPKGWMCKDDKFLVNPTGIFTIGGPESDSGLTGRKIIVDTYGGAAPHGGGAFSGKDPSKVDRSAAYMARYIAKNIVAAKLADKCLVQLSYAIGVAKPISLYIDTFGTSVVDEINILKAINSLLDLTPKGIKKHLKLNKAIYLPTATYGHFGRPSTREGLFSWEKIDQVENLKKLCL